MIAAIPANEAERLAALRKFDVLDTDPEAAYDDLTRLAADICGTPIAVISLIDATRQWFKSKVGIPVPETPRQESFCQHTILGNNLLVVPDTTQDVRFVDNPSVTCENGLRFYAGMPLTTDDNLNLGTLCVADTKPREMSMTQLEAVRVLARQVMTQLELRIKVKALEASEQRFQAFMNAAPVAAFIKDADGKYQYVNETMVRRFGKPRTTWLGHDDKELFPEQYSQTWQDNDRRVLANGKVEEFIEQAPLGDGTLSEWKSYKFPFRDADDSVSIAGVCVDVTEKSKIKARLRASEAKFRTVIDRLDEGVYFICHASGNIIEANDAVLAMLGYTKAEFLAMKPEDFIVGEDIAAVKAATDAFQAKLKAEGRCNLGPRKYRAKDGHVVEVDVRIGYVPDGDGLSSVIVRDITEQLLYEDRLFEYQLSLEDMNAKLKRLSNTDALTGVRNRGAFNTLLHEEFDRSVRFGHPLSVMLLDVDHFKSFNDTYGHPAGDEVLKAVSKTLADTARTTDVVARYGGEEFAIILPDTDYAGALVLAERCRRAIAATHWPKRTITISVGVSTLSAATSDASLLVQHADQALYRSKEAGRNRVKHGSDVIPALMALRVPTVRV